jgi:acetylornithine deacetylase/succinyl-diaminopimelate desuccinylase-like protein
MKRPDLLICTLLLASHPAWCGSRAAEAARYSQRNFAEFIELLSIENVADQPQDMQRNAQFLEGALVKRGFTVRKLDNAAGRPVVYAELGKPRRDAATVLFYIHFDGQPVLPETWSQPDPFEPVIKKRDAAGQWRVVERTHLTAEPLDPELRVYARSASDDKAPIMMLLTALDILRADKGRTAVNVKLLLDPEEEAGSPNLGDVVRSNPGLFAADAMLVLDGPVHSSGRPTIAYGNRGITQTTLTVFGPRGGLHSGHYGNYAPNPAQRLAELLATMKDDDGRVTIAGYYDGVSLTDADRASLASAPDDEPALLRRIGVARAERVGGNYQESLQYPSLNVRGMASAGVGAKAANIVPAEAVAELDLRTTPETDGRRLAGLIRRHIEAQGYRLVDKAPTDEERTQHDKLASFSVGSVQAAQRTPLDAAVGRWVVKALGAPTAPQPDVEPVRIRMMGGTLPTDVLVDALRLPFVIVPTVNPDNNQHASDENLRIGNFVTGVETVYSLLTTPYPR